MPDLVIRNGTVISGGRMAVSDVAVEGGRIAAVGAGLRAPREIDATGCYVIPGGVDPHVHLQMRLGSLVSSDSFATGSVAAVCGGTTTFVDFVTPAAGERMTDALGARRGEAEGNCAADYGFHMTIPTWHAAERGRLDGVPEAAAGGCCTFKLYQAYPDMMLDDVALLAAMQAIARAGGRAVLHAESGPVIDALRAEALREGHTDPIWHERTRPANLEASAISRASSLAQIAKCPLYIFHVGCWESAEAIRRERTQPGIALVGESCPQYLVLSADEHLAGPNGERYICAPPLRSVEDQGALWNALEAGDLAVVSTDHCPWTLEEKAQPNFALVPGGVPGIEARLALVYHFGVGKGRLSATRWVDCCCTAPARLTGLKRKGLIAPGYDADVAIFDPRREWTIAPSTLHEAAGWTPYDGFTIAGKTRTVLLRGKIVVEDERYVGSLDDGQFIVRSFA